MERGTHLLCSIVDAFEDLAEGSLADAFLLGEYEFRIDFLRGRNEAYTNECTQVRNILV